MGGPPKLGRPPRFERRAVLGAIFYMVRTGGSWRLLPHDLPPWRIVYYSFALWRAAGLFEKLHDALRAAARLQSGKKKPRRPRSTDSQSVRTTKPGRSARLRCGQEDHGPQTPSAGGYRWPDPQDPGPRRQPAGSRRGGAGARSNRRPALETRTHLGRRGLRRSQAAGLDGRALRPTPAAPGKKSAAATRTKALSCSRGAGSSNAPSAGSITFAA